MLGVLTVGDPAGYPVIHNHGGLSSRLDVVGAHDAALGHGLRIISPDRPGIGSSNPRPGRTLDDWASDVAELADALCLERFAVMGWSLGGSFAQAITHAVAEGLAHPHGVVEEYRILDSQWSFEPSRITAPTRIWQGNADDLVPAEWGKRLQDAIAGSTLTAVPGGTHFLAFDRWQEILGWLAEASR